MGFKKQKRKDKTSVTVQTARTSRYPFSFSGNYMGLSNPAYGVFDAIRENIPIVDAAISKIIRLIGSFTVECSDKRAEKDIGEFLKYVPTGVGSVGINSFVTSYLDSLIMYGSAIGEIVLGTKSGTVRGVLCGDIRDVELKNCQNPFQTEIFLRGDSGMPEKAKYPERLLLSTIHSNADHPMGKSLLQGLPFVSDILIKIYQSIGTNWERAGNIRYAVTYKPSSDFDGSFSEDRATEIAREWSAAMSDNKEVKDFVAIGDVDIKVIGADSQVLDSEIPVRQMLEQIVAKTGLPPFLLGLSWSTTERMSSQQADMLTSELEYYRVCIEPVLHKICSEYLRREGYFCDFKIVWDDISLQDMTEIAKARLYNAQADNLIKNETEVKE